MPTPVQPTPSPPKRVAVIGECMIELQGQAFGALQQSFGGDTLNTAVYLARCGGAALEVHYATALGDDALSDGLLTRWQEEGLHTPLVRRIPGRMPGLYQIEVDEQGERRFWYWRDTSAARSYFDTVAPTLTRLEDPSQHWDALYFSGITLAILGFAGRQRLQDLAQRVRQAGGIVAFDSNYRPRLWADTVTAKHAYIGALTHSTHAFVSLDDHDAMFSNKMPAHALPTAELVLKNGSAPTRVRAPRREWIDVPTEAVDEVVDTTAAGDAFAAAYLVRRLAGDPVQVAAQFGNRLAARVIQHAGALIPRAAMQDLMAAPTTLE